MGVGLGDPVAVRASGKKPHPHLFSYWTSASRETYLVQLLLRRKVMLCDIHRKEKISKSVGGEKFCQMQGLGRL